MPHTTTCLDRKLHVTNCAVIARQPARRIAFGNWQTKSSSSSGRVQQQATILALYYSRTVRVASLVAIRKPVAGNAKTSTGDRPQDWHSRPNLLFATTTKQQDQKYVVWVLAVRLHHDGV